MNTKELLTGLGGDGISVRSLASFTANNGVHVNVHIGRYRGTIALPPKLIVKGKIKDETKKLYDEYVSFGTLRVIPKEYEAMLNSIEGTTRNKLSNATIVDGFMPIPKYLAYKEDFESLRDEYFWGRDLILMNWDEIMEGFKAGLDELIVSARILKRDRETFKNSILSQIPSREKYKESFTFSLDVRAFPPQPDISMFDESIGKDIQNSWKDLVVNNAVGCISSLAQDVFSMCNAAIAKYVAKGAINGKTINSLIILGNKVKENNIFCNPLLQESGESLCKLANIDNPDEQEEKVENVLTSIYQYCKDTGVTLKFEANGLSEKTLESMLQSKAAQLKMAV